MCLVIQPLKENSSTEIQQFCFAGIFHSDLNKKLIQIVFVCKSEVFNMSPQSL